MHGKNFGWVRKIESTLKGHMSGMMNMSGMYKLITHMQLTHKLHSIVHHAAKYHHKMVHKLLRVMKKSGFAKTRAVRHTIHLVRHSKKILDNL